MLNKTNATKEKSVSEMFSQKQKTMERMAMSRDEAIDRAGRLTNATNLVIAFPDKWKEKLKEISECAREMGKMKEDNFIAGLHGGVKEVKFGEDAEERRKYEEDYEHICGADYETINRDK